MLRSRVLSHLSKALRASTINWSRKAWSILPPPSHARTSAHRDNRRLWNWRACPSLRDVGLERLSNIEPCLPRAAFRLTFTLHASGKPRVGPRAAVAGRSVPLFKVPNAVRGIDAGIHLSLLLAPKGAPTKKRLIGVEPCLPRAALLLTCHFFLPRLARPPKNG
eukprot:CAMPEP_0203973308 /NCGR_PEP_ID=MMETSP0359-20131031/99520_1 /ASSEMBLY_ACC=CAM_ASM_000338 /TAXON_ID=268821 /ORGANISM="Scrippsiella Hangoei, Strain SHTV-5" /LENGTH=163 /DNA_ID=CAMNT_0050911457 /DNA_START=641 /DNA_END=1133 /DNA_ORIENTATION=-